jgi:hypothetical protein
VTNGDGTTRLGAIADVVQGLRTGDNEERLADERRSDAFRPALAGGDIERYGYEWPDRYVFYDRAVLRDDPAARPRAAAYWTADTKLLIQEVRNVHLPDRIVATIDREQFVGLNTTNAVVLGSDAPVSTEYVLAIVSSSLINELFRVCFVDNHVATRYLESIPVALPAAATDRLPAIRAAVDGSAVEAGVEAEADCAPERYVHDLLATLADRRTDQVTRRQRLELALPAYLDPREDGQRVADLGFTQPGADAGQTPVTADTTDYRKLSITAASVDRRSESAAVVELRVRYKPEGAGRGEYHHEGPHEALRITDLGPDEIALLEAIVPYAVEHPDRFDSYRNNATTRTTPVDRLRNLVLPELERVRDGLVSYRETVARAADLDAAMDRTDDLIDQIVYELYGLSDDEIRQVEARSER